KKEKWDALAGEEKEKFAPVCPDWVIELRSKSDSINELKMKMEKWIKNGCELGWLIDPSQRKVFVYKGTGERSELVGFDKKLSGENLLPDFELDLSRLL
ncbi:MAG: Uma2 family endonuclease, partial [Flammeovirgaceae bacterium]